MAPLPRLFFSSKSPASHSCTGDHKSVHSCRFEKPGTGIAFVLPVDQVAGLESQMERFKEEVREEYF